MTIVQELTNKVFAMTGAAGRKQAADDAGKRVTIGSRIVPVSIALDPEKWGRLDHEHPFEAQFAPHRVDMECGVISDREQGELKELSWYIIRNMEEQADDKIVALERYGEIIINGHVWGHVRAGMRVSGTPMKFEEYFNVLPGHGSVQFVLWGHEAVFDRAASLRDALSATLQVHPHPVGSGAGLDEWRAD